MRWRRSRRVDKQFVETGDILWVFKNLPLAEHPQAAAAATAAECAGEQGKFWEMHDALFETVEQWAVDDVDPELIAIAAGLGLEAAPFATCLSSRGALERVLGDVQDAQGVVSVTPTFIALYGRQWHDLSWRHHARGLYRHAELAAQRGAGGRRIGRDRSWGTVWWGLWAEAVGRSPPRRKRGD